MSGNGRHRRPRQVPAIVVAAGVTGSAIAIPLLASASANAADTSTWDKVAACESGGNWSANLSNGYFGGLQIGQATWDQFGGYQYASRPDLATRSQQIAVAEKILAEQGAETWSSCADSAGLPSGGSQAGSGGSSDGGSLGDVLNGLLGGSHHSGGGQSSHGSGDTDATETSGTPSPSATDGSAGLGGDASSDDSATPGDTTLPSGTAADAPDTSGTPTDSASPGASHAQHQHGHVTSGATGGRHRATGPSSGDDGGFPLSVSGDNDGGLVSGSPTGGAGSIGNADLPGVVPDASGASAIRIPFAPQDASGDHAGGPTRSLWQFPDEAAWAGPDAAPATPAASGPAGSSSVTAVPGGGRVTGGSGDSGDGPGVTTGVTNTSPSATTGGKHRGGAASEPSAPAASTSTTAVTPETDEGSQTGQTGQSGLHGASGDSSSHGAASSAGSGARYIVHAGDSLSGIAASRQVDGGWHALYEANKAALGSDPDHIVPGQTLQLGVD